MRICVIGTGHVGLVTGTCLSDTGQFVTCVDANDEKIRMLRAARPPFYEPGLAQLLQHNMDAGRLTFTTDIASAIAGSSIIFVAVGTPGAPDGSVDLSQVICVSTDIARYATASKIVVMKSTVPVGTYRTVGDLFSRDASVPIAYVSNPEFLKEGSAIQDFTKPDRVIIGSEDPGAAGVVARLYYPYMRRSERFVITDPASAELTKYAANTLLATRISFMNEIAKLCDAFGANVTDVRHGVGSDRRIGSAFLFPGPGYGGSCFPKDVQALVSMGRAQDCPMRIAEATHQANLSQLEYFKSVIDGHFRGRYAGTRLAVWGLAYKAGTDDTRNSPAISIVRWLTEQGATVVAHDPRAIDKARAELGNTIMYSKDLYAPLQGADALIVMTDSQEFRNPDWDYVKSLLKNNLVIDGHNLYDLADARTSGLAYLSIGRPDVIPDALSVYRRPLARSA